MIKPSRQQVMKKFDALPQNLKLVMVSAETSETFWSIGEAHHLTEERIRKIAAITSYIILGFVHPEDLAKEIATETDIDKRLADEVAREIQLKILNPILPEINRLYGYGGPEPQPSSPATATLPITPPSAAPPSSSTRATESLESTIIKPVFADPPRTPETRTEAQRADPEEPFILHEAKEEIEPTRPYGEEAVMRPVFYEGGARERGDWTEWSPKARLEISGISPEAAKEPEIGKTKPSKIRVVHYSGPKSPVDPFSSSPPLADEPSAPTASLETAKPPPPPEVHPENIVDLKDLPK